MYYDLFTVIVEELALLWGVIAFLRFFLQRGGMPMTNRFAKILMMLTQWIVKPARRLVKPVRGWDAAIVAAVFLVCVVARYVTMATGVILNPSWFKPSLILLEVSNAALMTSKCMANALVIIVVYRWMTRDLVNTGDPGVLAFHHIYDIVMRPFKGKSATATVIMRVGVFVLLLLWVLVVADFFRYYMDMNVG